MNEIDKKIGIILILTGAIAVLIGIISALLLGALVYYTIVWNFNKDAIITITIIATIGILVGAGGYHIFQILLKDGRK